MNTAVSKLMWVAVSLLGAFALGTIALVRDEPINAAWLVVAAVCSYLVGYRFYSAFIANTVFKLDENRKTPAHTMTDGLDYVPTNKYVLFGHHFAAIAGAGPLVGPVLAAQMGYLPGTLWIIVGAVFAGCVQDFIMLVFSARHGGQSLGQMIKNIMGREAGLVAQFGIFLIMTILLAVLGLVVVKALAESPWGTFTVAMTIPIALFMGLYMRFVRPGRIMEISVIGVVMLMAALIGGKYVGDSEVWGPIFTLTGPQIAWGIIIYGFVAAIMPVWMMQAPRDYLSTFLKIGTILGLAIGIIVTLPQLSFPAVSKFVDGTGPAFSGALFPFLFITIACGAISGFHALIASGTTPKMLDKEPEARAIGYGAMAMESFVAIMALTAACVLDPGEYFAVNSPAGLIGTTPESAAAAVTAMGFTITPEQLKQAAVDVGEGSILSRTGGAPTLALGMAHILSSAVGGEGAKAFWYHFAILFEALFILTTVTAGTRVARFMIQDFLSLASPELGKTTSWTGNVIGTGVLHPVPGRDRSVRRHQQPVGAVRHLQPDAGGHRADLHRRRLREVRVHQVHHCARLPAGRSAALHGDRRDPEDLAPQTVHRLPGACRHDQRQPGHGYGVGAGTLAGGNGAHRVQRLSRRRTWPGVPGGRDHHVGLRGALDPADAPRRARDGGRTRPCLITTLRCKTKRTLPLPT
jgi:carbon starvation protein CstA